MLTPIYVTLGLVFHFSSLPFAILQSPQREPWDVSFLRTFFLSISVLTWTANAAASHICSGSALWLEMDNFNCILIKITVLSLSYHLCTERVAPPPPQSLSNCIESAEAVAVALCRVANHNRIGRSFRNGRTNASQIRSRQCIYRYHSSSSLCSSSIVRTIIVTIFIILLHPGDIKALLAAPHWDWECCSAPLPH